MASKFAVDPAGATALPRRATVQFSVPPPPTFTMSPPSPQQSEVSLRRPRLHSSSSRPSILDKMSQMNLSFAGCGFLGVYHIGVAACIHRYCPQLLGNLLSGASAGAIAAAALICDMNLSVVMQDLIAVASAIRDRVAGPFSPFISVPDMLRAGLVKNLPENAHVLCSGRLHVSVTRLQDGQNCILSQFDSKEELISALMCTAFIPAFSGFRPPTYRGVRYMDGCYSNNLPEIDQGTITVSPFCGEADICPRDRSLSLIVVDAANTRIELTAENFRRVCMIMFPPTPETFSDLGNQGFNDAIRFLMRHDLMKCDTCVLTTEIVGRAYSSCGQLLKHVHCDDCSDRRQEALTARLPAHVHEPLLQHILRSRHAFRNWLLDFPGARYLLVLAVPWTISYRVIRALYKRMVSQVPKVGNKLEGMSMEVVRAVHEGFSQHLPQAQRLHASYRCRVNITQYGESAGLEKQETPAVSAGTSSGDAAQPADPRGYTTGFVKRYDREFQVNFTNRRDHTLCPTTRIETSSDAERLETEVLAAGSAADGGLVQLEPSAPVAPGELFDRDVVRMALDAQSAADCGVSWYYNDREGNVCLRHMSAVQTPVVTPSVSRRPSFELDPAALEAAIRRSVPADEGDPDALREEDVTYDAGMGVIKEEANDMLPED